MSVSSDLGGFNLRANAFFVTDDKTLLVVYGGSWVQLSIAMDICAYNLCILLSCLYICSTACIQIWQPPPGGLPRV